MLKNEIRFWLDRVISPKAEGSNYFRSFQIDPQLTDFNNKNILILPVVSLRSLILPISSFVTTVFSLTSMWEERLCPMQEPEAGMYLEAWATTDHHIHKVQVSWFRDNFYPTSSTSHSCFVSSSLSICLHFDFDWVIFC